MTSDPQENFNVASLPQHTEVMKLVMLVVDLMYGGDSDDDVVDVGQEIVVMKRSDQLLGLFSGGDRVGGEAARGLESRDTPDGEIIENFVRFVVEMN